MWNSAQPINKGRKVQVFLKTEANTFPRYVTRKGNGSRTYSVGTGTQQCLKVAALNTSLKRNSIQDADEWQIAVTRKNLLDVSSKASIFRARTSTEVSSSPPQLLNVQDALPTDCRDALSADAQLNGQLSGGNLKAGIYGTSSTQLGVSSTSALPSGSFYETGASYCDP